MQTASLSTPPMTGQPFHTAVPTLSTVDPSATVGPADLATDDKQRARAYAARIQRLMSDPDYRAARMKLQRTQYTSLRSELVRALGVSAAEADLIIDYWARRDVIGEVTGARLAAAVNPEDLGPIDDEEEEATAANERELRDAVGADLANRLKAYEDTRESRQTVEALRSRLASAKFQLREEQIEPLVELLRDEQLRIAAEMRPFQETLDWNAGSPLKTRVQLHQRTLQAARDSVARLRDTTRSVLDDDQVRQLELLLGEDLERAQARMALVSSESRMSNPD
jgi:hypothetical protein